MPFNDSQVRQLLQPINPRRVLKDPKGNSHVAQQDITAHLTRIFGFGGWSKDVAELVAVFETERIKDGKPSGRWDVCYRARVVLTVRDEYGEVVTHFEDTSCGIAQNQTRGEAHDLACKSAVSLATKRAAKDLGDQFGLSLYNKGQMSALVGRTLVGLDAVDEVESHVEQQVSLGNDEVDRAPDLDNEQERAELRAVCDANGLDMAVVAARFEQDYGVPVRGGLPAVILGFVGVLRDEVKKAKADAAKPAQDAAAEAVPNA
jgi:hypothetical protein